MHTLSSLLQAVVPVAIVLVTLAKIALSRGASPSPPTSGPARAAGPAMVACPPAAPITAAAIASRLGLRVVLGEPAREFGTVTSVIDPHRVELRGEFGGRDVEIVDWSDGWPSLRLAGGRRRSIAYGGTLTFGVASSAQIEVAATSIADHVRRTIVQPRAALHDASLDVALEVRTNDPTLVNLLRDELRELSTIPCVHIAIADGRAAALTVYGGPAVITSAERLLPLLTRMADRIERRELEEERTIPMHVLHGLELGAPYRGAPLSSKAAEPPAPPLDSRLDVHLDAEETLLGRLVDVLTAPCWRPFANLSIGLFVAYVAARIGWEGWDASWQTRWWITLAPMAVALGAVVIGLYVAIECWVTRVVMRQEGFEWYGLGRPLTLRYRDVRASKLVRGTRAGPSTCLELTLADGTFRVIHHVRGLPHLQAAIDRARG